MQNCALCRTPFEPKELSHIVPAFVYRWLKETSVTGFMPYGPSMNRRVQDGIKDYFLCEACEDRFSSYEDVFAKEFFYPFVENNSGRFEYGENILRFAASASWRVLAYMKQKHGLKHFRGRHDEAVTDTLETWCAYLLGTANDVGRHEIHLLPFCGVIDYSGDDVPRNLNRYLRRAIEIDTVVSEQQAVTYCKLGPLILVGLIEYPDVSHWENTRICKSGRFGPSKMSCPAQYWGYIVRRSTRMQELEGCLSKKQLDRIKQSYALDPAKFEGSDTYRATMLDLELQFRKSQAE
jgi:hypothetical protein